MATVARQDDLQTLRQSLQERLTTDSLQVQCGFKQGTLIILIEHPGDTIPDPQCTFEQVQQILEANPPDFVGPVRLLLRVAGQKQPYAFHRFLLEPSPVEESFPDLTSEEKVQDVTPEPLEFVEDSESPVVDESQETITSETSEPSPQFPVWLMATGITVSVISFGVGLVYAFTRPCVLWQCTPLQEAKMLSIEAAKTIQETRNILGIEVAQQQLQQANQKLQVIPSWSKRYGNAQQLVQMNQEQAQMLDNLLKAMRKANEAGQKSQNPPHPMQHWREVQSLWQQAIAFLENYPSSSFAYPFADTKLQEYRNHLMTINKRLEIESQAKQHFQAAQEAARVAEARQGIAQTQENWEFVETTWQTAVSALEKIPQSTLVYAEAQKLLPNYQAGLASARDRKSREEFAQESYNQAIAFAAQAQAFEEQNDLSLAVTYWRQALDAVQQVPRSSLHYVQAQPLIATYGDALTNAQGQLQANTVIQTASNNLGQTCATVPPICSYSVTDQLMTVRLTPEYIQTLQQALNEAQATGDATTSSNIDTQIKTLQTNLQTISQNVGIPLELYDPENKLMGTFTPKPQ